MGTCETARTYDLTPRAWGCNYNILKVIDGGAQLKLAGWSKALPEAGDYLILRNREGTTRYKVDAVEYCGNPSDMFFADCSFAPREHTPRKD